jgi:hypothetical protein
MLLVLVLVRGYGLYIGLLASCGDKQLCGYICD